LVVAIIADTHLPRGSRRIPDACLERLVAADLIVHAGDLTTTAVLEELRSYGDVVAVHGNADEGPVRAALPAQVELELGGRRVAVIHDGGRRIGRLDRLRQRFPDAEAVIFGHSHTPLRETDADGFQIFNPGSPTDRRRAPGHTMGMAIFDRSQASFELVELD
jgi:putative phosphoesterase